MESEMVSSLVKFTILRWNKSVITMTFHWIQEMPASSSTESTGTSCKRRESSCLRQSDKLTSKGKTNSNHRLFSCPIKTCRKKFGKKVELNRHVSEEHPARKATRPQMESWLRVEDENSRSSSSSSETVIYSLEDESMRGNGEDSRSSGSSSKNTVIYSCSDAL